VHRYLTEPVDHPYTNAGKRPTPYRGRSFAFAPRGYADGMDDDAGAMAAWYIFGALGRYPLVPGTPDFVYTTPLIKRFTFSEGRP
jgi:putative alpha-1,2-mannosidase